MVHCLLSLALALLQVKPSGTQAAEAQPPKQDVGAQQAVAANDKWPEVVGASSGFAFPDGLAPQNLRGAGIFSDKPVARIPRQLVMTSKEASPDTLSPPVLANLRHTLKLEGEPQLYMRWLDDAACTEYLAEHFGQSFKYRLLNEPRGSFRGDICRAAVLYREGGFYVDLDVQMRVPLSSLVDDNTTFMTAFTADGAILNAIIATEPRNAIMAETLRELRRWYDGESSHYASYEEDTSNEWMGPMTMLRGLRTVMSRHCPNSYLPEMRTRHKWTCGSQRLVTYDERELNCIDPADPGECPPSRANSTFPGAQFGLFVAGPMFGPRKLVAWPRFEACKDWGCDGGGWSESGVQLDDGHRPPSKTKDL